MKVKLLSVRCVYNRKKKSAMSEVRKFAFVITAEM